MVEALLEAIKIFQKNQIDYCVIGGLAMMLHNGRANTVDIDFYVLVENLGPLKKIFRQRKIPVESKGEFQIRAKIKGVFLDILFADQYVGVDVVHRAVEKKLGNDFVRVATPEDLIVLKTVANRSIDRRDIEELRELFGKKLDEKYIADKLRSLKEKMES